MTRHWENPKAIQKLSELIDEFGKTAEYKINIQKSGAFLYTNNRLSEWKLRKQSHLQMHQKE